MSGPGVAALYGVVTFAALAALLTATLHLALGWPLVPSTNRAQGQVLLASYVLFGLFARAVGSHGARGATLGQAARGALGELGRGLRQMVSR